MRDVTRPQLRLARARHRQPLRLREAALRGKLRAVRGPESNALRGTVCGSGHGVQLQIRLARERSALLASALPRYALLRAEDLATARARVRLQARGLQSNGRRLHLQPGRLLFSGPRTSLRRQVLLRRRGQLPLRVVALRELADPGTELRSQRARLRRQSGSGRELFDPTRALTRSGRDRRVADVSVIVPDRGRVEDRLAIDDARGRGARVHELDTAAEPQGDVVFVE